MVLWLLPAIDFLTVPKGRFVFRFSSWIIVSPSWEQSINFLIKDCRVRRSDKSLFKNDNFIQFEIMGLLGMQTNTLSSLGKLRSTKIISTETIFFCGHLIVTKTALVWKKARGRPSHRANRQPAAKAGWSVFAESLAELLLIRDISFNIHVEITSDIEVNMSFSKFWILFYLPLRISTWPPQEASNEKYRPNPLSATSVCFGLV